MGRYHILMRLHRRIVADGAHEWERDRGGSDCWCCNGPGWDSVHLRCCLATILTVVTAVFMVVAAHGFAAPHRSVWSTHTQTVESIGRERDGECRQHYTLSTPHDGKG